MNNTETRERLESMILFFTDICGGQQRFGKTKLFKLLYYAEANARGMLGRPISDCTFVKKPFGPVPLDIDEILLEMESEGKISIQNRPLTHGDFQETVLSPRVDPPHGVLTGPQMDLLRLVANHYWDHSGRDISQESHDDIPNWGTLKPDGPVPVGLRFLIPAPPASPDQQTDAILDAFAARYHNALMALA